MAGTKHLIQCHCVLPQYRKMENPVFHKFIVFSKLDDDGDIIQKLAGCNNCGVVHKVIDMCKSEVSYGLDDSIAIRSIDDLKMSLPKDISNILEAHKCDLSTWEQMEDIFDENAWGSEVVISRASTPDATQLKCLIVKDEKTYKIETHLRQDTIG